MNKTSMRLTSSINMHKLSLNINNLSFGTGLKPNNNISYDETSSSIFSVNKNNTKLPSPLTYTGRKSKLKRFKNADSEQSPFYGTARDSFTKSEK